MPRRRPNLRRRVFSGLVIDPSGCLLWTRETDKDGYGRLKFRGRWVRVHRAMFEWFVEPIPPELEPDHLCRVRRCASPAHLELVTHRENMLRAAGFAAENAAKTHCDKGHEYTPVNTYVTPSGSRDCRTCRRASWRRYYHRRRKAS